MLNKLFLLVRPHQWYKNVVVFLPIIFSVRFFELDLLISSIFAFISLCMISSSSYILNDIKDVKEDRLHPEKKKRPIASGAIPISIAIIISTILLLASVYLALNVSTQFIFFMLSLFVLTNCYTLFLKKILFADIILIGTNFVIRTISGSYLLEGSLIDPTIELSAWLVLIPFFFALLSAASKRYGDLKLLENPEKSRKVLKKYNFKQLDYIINISSTLIIISYSLYTYYNPRKLMMITIPFIVYGILYYKNKIDMNPKYGRKLHLFLKDINLIITGIIYVIIAGSILLLN